MQKKLHISKYFCTFATEMHKKGMMESGASDAPGREEMEWKGERRI